MIKITIFFCWPSTIFLDWFSVFYHFKKFWYRLTKINSLFWLTIHNFLQVSYWNFIYSHFPVFQIILYWFSIFLCWGISGGIGVTEPYFNHFYEDKSALWIRCAGFGLNWQFFGVSPYILSILCWILSRLADVRNPKFIKFKVKPQIKLWKFRTNP